MSIRTIFERCHIYVRYYLKSKTIFQIHSPYLYSFIRSVFDSSNQYYAFRLIESWHRDLLANESLISSTDYSNARNQANQKVKDFHAKASSPLAYAEILYRIMVYTSAKNALELGTCLGMSTVAMGLSHKKASITSVDANDQFCNIVNQLAGKYKLENLRIINSDFHYFLQSNQDHYDIVFLDGDHTYENTMSYVKQLLKKINPKSIIILDDIHWSSGMYAAWLESIRLPEVQCSLETMRWGLLFLIRRLIKNI